jgi:carboxylesterase
MLLMHSREDHVVEPSNSAWILGHVSSADATEIWLENSYHVATLDNDAPLIFSTSVDFINRVATSSTSG